MNITNWKQFIKIIRPGNRNLLKNIHLFCHPPLFITGCQRSGTTILEEIFLSSPEIEDYRGRYIVDSELEGALILSDNLDFKILQKKKYCFQTTYINQNVEEYYKHIGKFKLIFILRNPYSVVYSMCYNWKSRFHFRNFALNELFENLGKQKLTTFEHVIYKTFGSLAIPKIRKACLAYVGKVGQVFDLYEKLGDNIIVVDYDDLVSNKDFYLQELFAFSGLVYNKSYGEKLSNRSIDKASKLSRSTLLQIEETCVFTYEKAKVLTIKIP